MLNRRMFGFGIASSVFFFLFPRKIKASTIVSDSQLKELNPYLRGCLLSGPGRGDCSYFVGLPKLENDITTDVYGRPHGWCEVCWLNELITRLHYKLYHHALSYGGQEYAITVVKDAFKNRISFEDLAG
jgi:hypothetical protein